MQLKINIYARDFTIVTLTAAIALGVNALISSLFKAYVKPDPSKTSKIQEIQAEQIRGNADILGLCAAILTIVFATSTIMDIVDRQ